MKRTAKILILSLILAPLLGAAGWWGYITHSSPEPVLPASMQTIGVSQKVDIGEGVQLHLYRSGPENPQGPTVVFEAGLNGTHASWLLVQREVAPFAMTCSYDRAGHGLSNVGPEPRTSKRVAQELHTLLKKADLPGPYILVGHSLGGIHVRTFAALYPQDVAGVILVDAMHEDQRTEIGALPWPKSTTLKERMEEFLQTHFPQKNYSRYRQQYQEAPKPEPYTQEEWDYLTALQASYKHFMSIEYEDQAIPQSSAELKALNRDLGKKPLIVLTAGKDNKIFDPNKAYESEEALNYAKIFTQCQQIRFRLQESYLRYSTNSKQRFAQNSGHGIPQERPEIIVEAIREVLLDLRHSKT